MKIACNVGLNFRTSKAWVVFQYDMWLRILYVYSIYRQSFVGPKERE